MANEPTPTPRRADSDTPDERLQRIRQVIDACLVQRATGNSLSDAALIAQYPELMPELDDHLNGVRLIARARERADGIELSADSSNGVAPISRISTIRIQCPECQAAIPLAADAS